MRSVVLLLCALVLCTATSTEWNEPEYIDGPESNEMRFQQLPWDLKGVGDVVQGQGGFQAPLLKGHNFAPGNYWPPMMPYRFPSFPYDNPTYTPLPGMLAVGQPPAWRSDPFSIHSDGARYLTNMNVYDFFPHGGGGGGSAGGEPPAG